jgi:hypothetical protein
MKFWHRLPENVIKFHFSTPERMTNFMLKALYNIPFEEKAHAEGKNPISSGAAFQSEDLN